MRTNLVTPPAAEPVTRDEAKAWLRLEIADDDLVIDGLIVAARQAAETRLRRAIITQTWAATWDHWPFLNPARDLRTPRKLREIHLPYPALQSVASLTYYDLTGTLQTLDPSVYQVSLGTPGRITLIPPNLWPPSQPGRADAIACQFTCGYGNASAVPESVKLGIKVLVALYYENREAPGTVPEGVSAIFADEEWGYYPR